MSLIDTLRSFLDDETWAHEVSDDGKAVRMGFRGTNGEWPLLAQEVGDDEGGKLVIYSKPANLVPEDRRAAAAEAICRINYGLILGNWEMDVRDGEVRFKTSADLRGTPATAETMRHLVFTNVLMVERYLPALLGVAFGGKDPALAVDEVERDLA